MREGVVKPHKLGVSGGCRRLSTVHHPPRTRTRTLVGTPAKLAWASQVEGCGCDTPIEPEGSSRLTFAGVL